MDVCEAVQMQNCDGPNALTVESFMSVCAELWVHLSILFLAFLYSFLPAKFIDVTIIPLSKDNDADFHKQTKTLRSYCPK